MEIRNTRPKHLVYKYEYNVEEQKEYILSKIALGTKAAFTTIFSELRDRMHAIITFLSLLEMINSSLVTITPGEKVNEFWLEAA